MDDTPNMAPQLRTPLAPQLLEEVLQQQPTDSQVLQTLVTVCKVMGKTSVLPVLYEAAVVANPGDMTLLRGLFAVYVRYVTQGWMVCVVVL